MTYGEEMRNAMLEYLQDQDVAVQARVLQSRTFHAGLGLLDKHANDEDVCDFVYVGLLQEINVYASLAEPHLAV